MYLVIFDKAGRGLSGWHYNKLREIGARWVQKSAIGADDMDVAEELVEKLREFGVQKIRVFVAVDVTDSTKVRSVSPRRKHVFVAGQIV